jgi:hypothetical protein
VCFAAQLPTARCTQACHNSHAMNVLLNTAQAELGLTISAMATRPFQAVVNISSGIRGQVGNRASHIECEFKPVTATDALLFYQEKCSL